MKILVTGFECFGNFDRNPSLELIKLLPPTIKGAQILTLEIPTVFKRSVKLIQDTMAIHNPDVVLSLGQASGRPCISVERVAINVDDALIADNDGNLPLSVPIIEHGENAYFSNLPINAMVQSLKNIGQAGIISNSAGTYVCNHVMYHLLYMANTTHPQLKVGFIHVPLMTQQTVNKPDKPSMSLEDMSKGLIACLETIVDYADKPDIVSSAMGALN